MILVTGATGNVGTELVKQLSTAGHKVRALVRDVHEAAARFTTTVDLAVGDFDDVDSLARAMTGIERVYLIAPFTPELPTHEANLIDGAKLAGVRHVVKQSMLGAQHEAITLARWHRAGEQRLESSGLAWTHLRPSGFMTNALAWAAMIRGGTVYSPTGDGKVALVDARDLAAVAVLALTRPGHEGKAYDLTGPEALSTAEQVRVIGRAIGKSLAHADIGDAAAKESMLRLGVAAAVADLLLEVTAAVRGNRAAQVTQTVKQLTGRPPRAFGAWADDHAASFR